MQGTTIWGATRAELLLYYTLVGFSLVYFLFRYRKDKFSILVILLFYSGFFAFLGKNALNLYRIGITLFSLYILYTRNGFRFREHLFISISFLSFAFVFILFGFINGDYFNIIFSQFSRYLILFSLFFITDKSFRVAKYMKFLENLIYKLIIVQVLFSIVKFFNSGTSESLVGTIQFDGGAGATVFPVLGFIVIWLRSKGKLSRKDWLLVFGLLFMGFVSLKRAIWFVMPLVLGLFIIYIPHRKIRLNLVFLSVVLIPTIFYFGIRLNPSLNPENKVWGSFDVNYTLDFARVYTQGSTDRIILGEGRLGATMLLMNKFFMEDLTVNDWVGYGLRAVYAQDYGEFAGSGFGLNHKGSATGLFQTYIANGFIGVFLTLLFVYSIIREVSNFRYRVAVIIIFIWEYFFYTGLIIREHSFTFLLVYIILYPEFLKRHNWRQRVTEKLEKNPVSAD